MFYMREKDFSLTSRLYVTHMEATGRNPRPRFSLGHPPRALGDLPLRALTRREPRPTPALHPARLRGPKTQRTPPHVHSAGASSYWNVSSSSASTARVVLQPISCARGGADGMKERTESASWPRPFLRSYCTL